MTREQLRHSIAGYVYGLLTAPPKEKTIKQAFFEADEILRYVYPDETPAPAHPPEPAAEGLRIWRCDECDHSGPEGWAVAHYNSTGHTRFVPNLSTLTDLLGRVAEGFDIEHESYVQVTGGKHREPCKTCDLIVEAKEAIWHPSPTSEELVQMTSIGYHDECSDPEGKECQCPCHRKPAPPEAARRWICQQCGVTVPKGEVLWDGYRHYHFTLSAEPMECGPVVEDAGSAGGGT
jgi:hypothetical protein